VTPAAFLVHSRARLAEGTFPGPGELLAGSLAAARLGVPPERLAPGSRLSIDGREWTIRGRLEAPGTVMDAELWAPLQELLVATQRVNLSTVAVTMEDGDPSEAQLFAKRRLDLELAAIPEEVYYDRLHAFYGPVRGMVWATALLVAAGAFLGGLNTLYASFAARVREMATLQVLGFSRRAVALGLVLEAVLVSSAGSLVAAAVAAGALDGVAVRISLGAFGLRVDGPVMAFGLACGIGLGTVGALLPAWRCLRLPVAEALRSA
jgi:putative ABC transport system permease protein